MTNKQDLTQGGVKKTLLRMALPIMAMQFMQMAYSFIDMFWLGRLSNDALAASGTAALFVWLSVGLMLIGRVGAEIGVSQSRGRGELETAFRYSRKALYISAVLGLAYGSLLFFGNHFLVGLFNFREAHVASDTAAYIRILSLSMPFMYISAAIGGSFTASGDTRTPFLINAFGIFLNTVLDPVFIFTLGLGVRGAAWITVIAQSVVVLLMLTAVKRAKNRPFEIYKFFDRAAFSFKKIWMDLTKGESAQIFKWTIPIFLENTFFCFLTMITSRFEVSFGAYAIAMSRVGSQVESLSWLIGAGFGAAITSFIGQNFGAGRTDRIKKSVRFSIFFMTGWGLFVTAILFFGGGIIFDIFMPELEYKDLAITFCRLLAIYQVAANLESVAAGAFRGMGRTVPPSITSITSMVIRVPLAYVLSQTSLGLLGVWIAVSVTAGLKGVSICVWYFIEHMRKRV
jgi:putative MATE family efflux protein